MESGIDHFIRKIVYGSIMLKYRSDTGLKRVKILLKDTEIYKKIDSLHFNK
jgi:hypothetical protein